jgi:hypothetical protein
MYATVYHCMILLMFYENVLGTLRMRITETTIIYLFISAAPDHSRCTLQ